MSTGCLENSQILPRHLDDIRLYIFVCLSSLQRPFTQQEWYILSTTSATILQFTSPMQTGISTLPTAGTTGASPNLNRTELCSHVTSTGLPGQNWSTCELVHKTELVHNNNNKCSANHLNPETVFVHAVTMIAGKTERRFCDESFVVFPQQNFL